MTKFDDRTIARWRLRSQQLTADPARTPTDVVGSLLGVQAENHDQASWAVSRRTVERDQTAFDTAFDAGDFLRTHVLRPTWHFVLPEDISWLLELTRPRVERSYRQVAKSLDLAPRDIERAIAAIGEAIAGSGPLPRDALRARVEDAGIDARGQRLGIALGWAELESLICSGPLIDGDHTFALVADRAPRARRLDREEALAEIARRYFTSHGPATERDLSYWASLTLTDVRAGIAAVVDSLESFEHEGRTYFHGAPRPSDDELREPAPGLLLQILDECYRGYQDSRWVIDAEGIVPRAREKAIGIAIVDAQVLGWMRRTVRSSAVEFEIGPYRELRGDEMAALHAAAAEYGEYVHRAPEVTWAD